MEATEESVTDYFLYVKNVLGVKTLQSSSLALQTVTGAEPAPAALSKVDAEVSTVARAGSSTATFKVPTAGPEAVSAAKSNAAASAHNLPEKKSSLQFCDLLFLNIRIGQEESVFSTEIKSLADKMIQAMRLGNRKIQIEEISIDAGTEEVDATQVLQSLTDRVKTSFVVLFSSKPGTQGVIKNLGRQKYIETFSPSYLAEHPQAKKVAWLDLQKVMKELGIS